MNEKISLEEQINLARRYLCEVLNEYNIDKFYECKSESEIEEYFSESYITDTEKRCQFMLERLDFLSEIEEYFYDYEAYLKVLIQCWLERGEIK